LDAARKAMAKAFNIRLDVPRERRTLHQREGLSIEVFDRLVVAVRPDAANNPWGDRVVSIRDAVRARNQAMVLTTALLGLRRGELLGLKVQDVWMTGTIPRLLIARRADDPDDPRPDQPTAKTGDGVVELPSALSDLLEDYIFNVRAKTPGAKRHPYIWVGHKPGRNLGQPLAMVSLTALYRRLRENVDGLPPDLSGHVLRHTWNDRFSQLCDQSKVPEEKEKLIRNYLMRWTPTSDTAVRYTRRHVRDKANEFSMRHQGDMLERAGLDVRGVLQGEKQNSQ
jgi:integrase